MDTLRKNAILLFSKVPEAGKVKTRLTPIKDGYYDPEVASALYHCMLFDVVEICCDACLQLERESTQCAEGRRDAYDIIISAPGEASEKKMRELFEASGVWPRELIFIHDDGSSFDEHYNNAFQQAWDMGYETILSMGCDMPALRRSILVEGFHKLHRLCASDQGGIVLAPDQEMGVSIVGWTANTDFDHTGVFYNSEGLTVLPAYIQKAQRLGLAALYLPDVPDVDTHADLNHNVTLVQALEYCGQFDDDITVPHRCAQAFREMGLTDIRVMPNALRDDRNEIDSQ